MSSLKINCNNCTYENKLNIYGLRLNKEYNCINCNQLFLIVDRELLDQIK